MFYRRPYRPTKATSQLVKPHLVSIGVFLVGMLWFSPALNAQTWSGLGGDNLWSNPNNWVSGNIPDGTTPQLVTFSDDTTQNTSTQDLGNPFQLFYLRVSPTTTTSEFEFSGQDMVFGNASFTSATLEVLNSLTGNVTFNNNWIVDHELRMIGNGDPLVIQNGNITNSGNIENRTHLIFNGNFSGSGKLHTFDGKTEIAGTVGAGDAFELTYAELSGSGTINRGVTAIGIDAVTESTINASGLTVNGDINAQTFRLRFSGGTLNSNGNINAAGASGARQLTFDAGSTLAGTGDINITGAVKMEVNGTIGAGQTLNLDGADTGFDASRTELKGTGIINAETVVTGGLIRDGLTFNNTVRFQENGNNVQIGFGGEANDFNSDVFIETGTVNIGGILNGNGTFFVADNAEIVSSPGFQINLKLSVDGSMTDVTTSETVVMQSGVAVGTNVLSSSLTVENNLMSNVVSGASLSVAGLTRVESGVLSVDNGALLDGAGIIEVDALSDLDVNGNVNKDVMILVDATLRGSGTILGNVDVDGELSPGNSAGTLTIDGSIELTGTSTTTVEIGGPLAGADYDQIRGMGAAISQTKLDGRLDVSFIGGFFASTADEFFIFENIGVTGKFTNALNDLVLTDQGIFDVDYGSDFVRLHNLHAIPEPGSCALISGLAIAGLLRRRRANQ